MKKIAFVSNTSWSIYNFRLEVIKALKEKGYYILVFAPYDKYSDLIIELGLDYHNIEIDNRGTNPIKDFKTVLSLYKLFKYLNVDLVFNYTIKPCIYGSLAAKFANTKSISVITGLGYVFTKKGFLQTVVKWLYKISLSTNSAVWFLNNDDRELFLQSNIITNKINHLVIPGSGVNTKKFSNLEVSVLKSEGINVEQFSPTTTTTTKSIKFLLVARMLWDKGVGEYVEAARLIKQKYPNIVFQLLGFLDVDNPNAISRKQMQSWVDEGVVEYMGVSDKVQEIIQNVDCVVLPSYYREGVPRVLLEAASMAKPIITTDNVGCRDVVDDGINGYLCEIKNPQDLAQKIERMINLSEDERTAMGRAGREKMIREFDVKAVIKKYLETVERIL